MAVKNPSRVWKNTEGNASGGFPGQSRIPFSNFGNTQSSSQDQPDPQNPQQRKRRSPVDDYNSVKNAVNTAKTVVKIARYAFNPWVLVGIFIFIIIYMLFFGGGSSSGLSGGGNSDTSQQGGGTVPPTALPSIPGFTINLTGDPAVGNGVPINYTITYTYDPSKNNNIPLSQISIYDDLPSGVSFGSTSGKSTQTGSAVSWILSDNPSPITFTLKPTSDDINISNYVYAKSAGAISSASNIPPTTNDCGDPGYERYMDANPTHQNYGDPNCEVDNAISNPTHRDIMYGYVKSVDPTYADIWFKCIAYGESRWNPNAFAYPDPNSGLDPAGSWGLFQMGRGLNGQYDHGDVYWKQQVQNAVNDNNLRQIKSKYGKFAYWIGEIGGHPEDGTLTCINGLTPPGGF